MSTDWPIVFSDATALLVAAVGDGLVANSDTATVHGKVPNPRPDRFVTVRRVGGPRLLPMVDEATVQVDSWALRMDDAMDLASLVRAVMHGLRGRVVDGVTVYRVQELAGPSELPDPDSDQPRVRQNFAVMLRGSAMAVV